MATTQDLILAEVQALRFDFNQFARDTAGRVSTLEANMHSLIGNGQPGRVSKLESKVTSLGQWRWWVVGCAAGSSGLLSVVAGSSPLRENHEETTMTTAGFIGTLVGYFVFSAAVDAMPKPGPDQERKFYGWLYRFLNILAANASRLAHAKFGALADRVDPVRRDLEAAEPPRGDLPAPHPCEVTDNDAR